MKAKELRELDVDALRIKADEFREEAFWLKFKAQMGQMSKNASIGEAKRNLARVLTVMQEKIDAEENQDEETGD